MLRFAVGLKPKVATHRSVPQKTTKMKYFGVNDTFLEKLQNSVQKKIMTTPIYGLFPNFTEIDCQQVG